MNYDDFFSQPYKERQFVVFKPELTKPTVSSMKVCLKEILNEIKKHPIKSYFRQISGYFNNKIIIQLLEELFKDNKTVTFFPQSWVEKFILPKDYRGDDKLYIGHPIPSQNNFYYPVSEFHRCLHREKSLELITILRSLKLKSFELQHIEGFKDIYGNEIDLDIKTTKTKIKADRQSKKTNDISLIWKESKPRTDEDPELPENLIWYEYEETWKSVVEEILKKQMRDSVSFKYNYSNDYGVDNNLSLAFANNKIGLKKSEKYFRSTEWFVKIELW